MIQPPMNQLFTGETITVQNRSTPPDPMSRTHLLEHWGVKPQVSKKKVPPVPPLVPLGRRRNIPTNHAIFCRFHVSFGGGVFFLKKKIPRKAIKSSWNTIFFEKKAEILEAIGEGLKHNKVEAFGHYQVRKQWCYRWQPYHCITILYITSVASPDIANLMPWSVHEKCSAQTVRIVATNMLQQVFLRTVYWILFHPPHNGVKRNTCNPKEVNPHSRQVDGHQHKPF